MNISLDIPKNIAAAFSDVCSKNKFSQAEVLQTLMKEYIEDMQDYDEAIKIKQKNEPTISLEEMTEKYCLED